LAQLHFPWDFLLDFFPLIRRKCVSRGSFFLIFSHEFAATSFSVGLFFLISPTDSAQLHFPWVFLLDFFPLFRRNCVFRGTFRLDFFHAIKPCIKSPQPSDVSISRNATIIFLPLSKTGKHIGLLLLKTYRLVVTIYRLATQNIARPYVFAALITD
jgi:hypothetical protein